MLDRTLLSCISSTAATEGWKFIEQRAGAFAGLFMIGKDRSKDCFECDVDAEQFVRLQAANGSVIHRAALAVHKLPALCA